MVGVPNVHVRIIKVLVLILIILVIILLLRLVRLRTRGVELDPTFGELGDQVVIRREVNVGFLLDLWMGWRSVVRSVVRRECRECRE